MNISSISVNITIYDNFLFTIIVFFDDFINLDFILRISNTNFVYYYSSKEGQGKTVTH